MTDVAEDLMMNLGKTLHFFTDKYGQTMMPEVRVPRARIGTQLMIR